MPARARCVHRHRAHGTSPLSASSASMSTSLALSASSASSASSADLHELDDRLDHFRRLRVVGRHIGRHVELDREPWRCHGNTVAWVARNRGKRVRSDGQSSVRMDNLTGPPFLDKSFILLIIYIYISRIYVSTPTPDDRRMNVKDQSNAHDVDMCGAV